MAQVAAEVGDIDGNVERILAAWRLAAERGADVVVFTELTVTGYPPEDLLLKDEFVEANLAAVDRLAAEGPRSTTAVVGHVGAGGGDATDAAHWDVALASRALTNSVTVLRDNAVVTRYDKLRLPNYGVFDEARYFSPGGRPAVVDVDGRRVGVIVCEDLWHEQGPAHTAVTAGAEVLLVLNASPYHRGKRADRERWATYHAAKSGVPVVYVNVVGGQDEVVFDGDSFAVDRAGRVIARAAQFTEDLVVVDVDAPAPETPDTSGRLDETGEVWHALVRSVGDYCRRNGFQEVIVGLSGGIDSAVTAAIAADALGGDHVLGVAMPSPYSSDHSLDDAAETARLTGCRYEVLAIGGPLAAVSEVLDDLVVTGYERVDGQRAGVAYENLQARLRGVITMALANERGSIVLTTGNKSEYAVGYATLYGDMAGGFAPLKDVPKGLVYELARWRNRSSPAVPERTIGKPPSAELRPGQLDQDSLPGYDVLDAIIEAYVERDLGIAAIVAEGHDEAVVRRVIGLIDRAEYKRRQAAPGPKITERAFGRDRRVPISSGWRG